jgi:hypothetical protein
VRERAEHALHWLDNNERIVPLLANQKIRKNIRHHLTLLKVYLCTDYIFFKKNGE